MTKPTTSQTDKVLGALSKQMTDRAKAGDFDVMITYVKKDDPKTFRSHARASLFTVAVTVMDCLARIGANEEDQKAVRDIMEKVVMRETGRISQADGKPVKAEVS